MRSSIRLQVFYAISFLAFLVWLPAPVASSQEKPRVHFPAHALVGYWQNFVSTAPVQRLTDVPQAYSVVIVAFGHPDLNADGGFDFEVAPSVAAKISGGYSEGQFVDDVDSLHRQGRVVLLSLGGQKQSFALNSDDEARHFADSALAAMRKWHFNGLDIDLENIITVGNYGRLAQALKLIRAQAGASFVLTMAPAPLAMLPSEPSKNAYLRLTLELGTTVTMVNTQFYNAGSKRGPDGNIYEPGTVDFVTSQIDEQLEVLSPSQVGIGVTAHPETRGYLPPELVAAAYDCLTAGLSCGRYRPRALYPTLRGMMVWSTNWDAAHQNTMEVALHQRLEPTK